MAQWIHALRTFNPEPGVRLGPAARWLVITRACVFSPHPILPGLVLGLAEPWIAAWLGLA